ncbi:MAG: sodium:calcium antiporter [Candidatus Pacebacteria bacterium]|nr:sodium:calcium antiporter [Candidatus Paceibacterota bacterium]
MFETLTYSAIFIVSAGAFYFSGELIVRSLIKIAKILQWKEFAISFVIMAIVASLPNLFVGIISAINKIPQLAFGDVIGGNVVDLTLSVALAALFAKKGIPAKSRTVQSTLIFTSAAAVFPVLLAWDGVLSRIDGIILISFYVFYLAWLFSKRERFSKTCEENGNIKKKKSGKIQYSLINVLQVLACVAVFIIAAQGIVSSAQYFAATFNWSLILIGLFIVGVGNCAPEIFFAIASARQGKRGHDWMILGDLMGAIIGPATFVLGTVALITPIQISDFSPFAVARIFLIFAIICFFTFVRNDQRISKKEAAFLLMIYVAFVITEIFVKL